MPINCPIKIEPLSTEAFRELDYQVMRHAFDSQNDLGRLADERIYQSDLADRLHRSGISTLRELEIVLSYDNFRKSLYLDLVVSEQGVYELKAVKEISEAHLGQLLTYLHLLDLPRGKLLNFGGPKVESQFVNAPLRSDQGRSFHLVDHDYRGAKRFAEHVVGLLRDWGTSLTLSLYQEALVELLGGKDLVEAMLPLHRDGICLGNQRFHLVDSESAFTLTALKRDPEAYEEQVGRLLSRSPLKAIHWVNIEYETVTLRTVVR
jgi:GxxExxY protein